MSIIERVSSGEGCPLKGVPLYIDLLRRKTKQFLRPWIIGY